MPRPFYATSSSIQYPRPDATCTIETQVAKDYSAMISIHFAQWMAMNYAEVLNTENGVWYTEQFLHFETHVWPKWVGNGAMVDYLDLLKKQQNDLVVR